MTRRDWNTFAFAFGAGMVFGNLWSYPPVRWWCYWLGVLILTVGFWAALRPGGSAEDEE